MNKIFAAFALTAALAGCEATGPGGMNIPADSVQRLSEIDATTLVPALSPQNTLSAFDAYCERHQGNRNGTRQAVLANDYFLLGTMTSDNLEMYASTTGGPLVATGMRDGATVCMVMVKESAALGRAIGPYVQQRHPGAVSVGEMSFGTDTAENIYAAMGSKPVLYFTLVQMDPTLGRIQAFATVTE